MGDPGPQGPAGAAGAAGAPGSVWRNGTGAPSNSLGINGDYYLDDATANVYQKSGGVYSVVANIGGGGGGGGFIANDRAISTGTADTASTSDGLILWNSPDAGPKQQVIPASTGSRQVIIVQDFIRTADDANPIIITPETGNINNSLPYVTISTPGDSLTLIDSRLGWVLQ